MFLGAAVLIVHPTADWVEARYVNGFYPAWEHALFSITSAMPWSLGDLAVLVGAAAIVARIITVSRRCRQTTGGKVATLVLDLLAVAALYAVWFEVSWGWNYDRAPIEVRTAYDARRVTPASLTRLRAEAIVKMNTFAGPAHAEALARPDLGGLEQAWLPVVQSGGDRWIPRVGVPKPTLADAFMNMSGTSGFINPLTLNVALASDLLWFERPFSLAHEWSHVAAYAREDEANYLAIVACTRSSDPAVEYSGWLELFLYLPPLDHYARATFSPLVWGDFAALRRRNARRVNLTLAHWSWQTYNVYLKSNRISSGIANYNEVTRLYLGIPRDRNGVPLARQGAGAMSLSMPRGTR